MIDFLSLEWALLISDMTYGKMSLVFELLFFPFYIFAAVDSRNPTRPSRSTWWILSLIALILIFTNKAEGASDTVWFIWGLFWGQLGIALLSIRYGESGWTLQDTLCTVGALLAIVFWLVLNDPLYALLAAIIADTLAILPTIHKSLVKPWSESRFAWLLTTIAAVLNLFALENTSVFDPATWFSPQAIFPIYMLLINGLILFLLVFNRRVPVEIENV